MTVRSLILAAAATAAMGFAAAPAFAAEIDDTRQRQQERIREGLRSGQLTRQEFVRLERQQEEIGGMIRRARADGHMSWRERQDIERAQQEASRHIFSQKHDDETRARRWWHRTSDDRGSRPWYRRWN